MRHLLAVTVTVAAVSLVIAGTALPAAPQQVKVTLKEFKVIPAVKSVKAGSVSFKVTNTGKLLHELIVVKSNAAPGKLPVTNGRVSEKTSAGEVPDVEPGASKSVTLKLAAGKYILLCNIKGHYQAGQWIGFTVK
jgi:uncharacterized cupredoxin-like copper-binding protein